MLGKEKVVITERQRVHQLIQKIFGVKMQEYVAVITYDESKILSEKFADSANVMRLAKCFKDNMFKRFANGIKVTSTNAASEIYSKSFHLC